MKGKIFRRGLLIIIIYGSEMSWGCSPPQAKFEVSRMENRPEDKNSASLLTMFIWFPQ
jgi:hypothetical protein